jgi:hypothetical protein
MGASNDPRSGEKSLHNLMMYCDGDGDGDGDGDSDSDGTE